MDNLLKKISMWVVLAGLSILSSGCGGKAHLFYQPNLSYTQDKGFYNQKSEEIAGLIEEEMRIQKLIVQHNESVCVGIPLLIYRF